MDSIDKYPYNYFAHWLAMYVANQTEWTSQNIIEHNQTYTSIEGDDEFGLLQNEIRTILDNNDLKLFLEFAKQLGSTDVKLEDIKLSTELILRD